MVQRFATLTPLHGGTLYAQHSTKAYGLRFATPTSLRGGSLKAQHSANAMELRFANVWQKRVMT